MHTTRSGICWDLLTTGFAATIAMWVVWFVVHHPAVALTSSASGPILLAVQSLVLGIVSTRWIAPARQPTTIIAATVGAGVLSGTINLASMGSMLVPQADPSAGLAADVAAQNHPSTFLMLAGYLGLSAVMGLFGGIAASYIPTQVSVSTKEDRLRRMALLALAATLPLLLLGGLVTSSLAGLSVPDWPGTYGGNMFLYPISLMASEKHVYLEHSHRLFGALVGMTSIALLATTLALESRRWMKAWAAAIFVLVCVQGLLGGFRVTESSTLLALAHGVLAQIVFLMMAMFAAYTTSAFAQGPSTQDPADRRRRILTTALLHSLLLQLALGAAYRHTGSAHILYTHIALAFLVVVVGMVAGMAANSRSGPVEAFTLWFRRTGTVVVAVVALQFILGWGAWGANPPSEFRRVPKTGELASTVPVATWKVAVRTAHQANGALLIASAGVLFVLVRRIGRDGTGVGRATKPVPSPLAAATG